MQRALNEFIIEGIDTTLELHKEVITSKDFNTNNYDIKWLENTLLEINNNYSIIKFH